MHRRRLAIVTMAAESAFTLLLALLSNETTKQLFCCMFLAYAAFTLANLGKVCARLDSLERETARLEQTASTVFMEVGAVADKVTHDGERGACQQTGSEVAPPITGRR